MTTGYLAAWWICHIGSKGYIIWTMDGDEQIIFIFIVTPARNLNSLFDFLTRYTEKYADEVRTSLQWKLKIFYRIFVRYIYTMHHFISLIKIPCTKPGIFNLNTPQIWEKLIPFTSIKSEIYKVNITKRTADPT